MVQMSSNNYMKKFEEERTRLLKELEQIEIMIPGSFKKVYRKCGKNNCRCKNGDGHPLNRITWLENGCSKTKSIPEKDIEWIIKMTDNYRRFRKIRKIILELQKKYSTIIDNYAKDIIKETRRLRHYL